MILFPLLGALALVGTLGLAPVSGGDPPAPKKADEAAATVRKAAETAEVHGVGVNEPAFARLETVSNWAEFIAAVRTKKGPAGRVWELFSQETQKRVADDKVVERLAKRDLLDPKAPLLAALKGSVVADLRKMIDNSEFYTEEAFKNVPLTKEMKEAIALGKKRTLSQTARLNWALLDAAFPGCLPAMPARFRTVRVQVVGGKDVVLVLSSSNQCRWEVVLLEGAKVTGVILCGANAQEIAGVDAPVVYRAYYAPDGVTLARPFDYFYAPVTGKGEPFNKDDVEQEKRFVGKVKDLTGKTFTSFQRDYYPEPGSEPYTIRPGAKK